MTVSRRTYGPPYSVQRFRPPFTLEERLEGFRLGEQACGCLGQEPATPVTRLRTLTS